MAAMREKYEVQLAGLKELRDVAPKRMEKLQAQWRKYVMEYSGAMLAGAEQVPFEGAHQSEMRPDTPELESEDETRAEPQTQMQANDAISVEEMNACLTETGRQASLQERAQEIAAREEMEVDPSAAMDEDEDEDEDAEPHAPTLPPFEYNSQGRLTACSKGKGSAD
ncbi:hypothetical protein BDV93DRAFT_119524 [Ceratobasidium sp. AG-I]|nr:hypothetical protein BDV93DRAFT_119524 [Ceratobasidium sp. AG-I]